MNKSGGDRSRKEGIGVERWEKSEVVMKRSRKEKR